MRTNLGAKELLYPMPVLMVGTFDENGNPDLMNAAWGGIGNDHEVFLCLSDFHKTTQNILKTRSFTVAIATEATLKACDYVGIRSANNVPDKMKKSGLTYEKSALVNAPIFNELPICLECSFTSYDAENCHLFGQILNVSVDDSVMTEGKVDLTKVLPLTFDPFNHVYRSMGEVAGQAFHDGLELD